MMRALVLGYGRMGKFHAKTLRNMGYLVTTVDPRDDSGARWRALPPGMYFEAAVVAVPIVHLAECAVDASRVCNKLLIEKPGASSLAEMRALHKELWASRPAVGYTERFNPVVRALAEGLNREQRGTTMAEFTRWSPRPSPDVWLDLLSHDVDLCRYLQLQAGTYDFKCDTETPVRTITLTRGEDVRTVDLMAHEQEPLYAQWHNFFLPGKPGLATLDDALKVIEQVEEMRTWARATEAAA